MAWQPHVVRACVQGVRYDAYLHPLTQSLIIVISPLPTIMRKLSFNVFKRFGRSNTQTKLEETPQSDLSRSTPNLLGSITSSRKVARRRLHKRLSGATGTEDDFSYTVSWGVSFEYNLTVYRPCPHFVTWIMQALSEVTSLACTLVVLPP